MRLKLALEQQFDVAALTELENDIRNKEAVIAGYQESITQIKKVGVTQEKVMLEINNDEEHLVKLRQLNDEIRKTKVCIRETQDKHKDLEKANQEQHRSIVDMDERCRKLVSAIALQKKQQQVGIKATSITKRKNSIQESSVSEQDEQELETAVKAAQDTVKEEEKKLRKQIMEVDGQLEKMKSESGREELKLKEKEQDIRLCELKIREVKRQMLIAAGGNVRSNNLPQKKQQNNLGSVNSSIAALGSPTKAR